MVFKRFKIVPTLERAFCARCDQEMKCVGNFDILSLSTQYEYRCPKCCNTEFSTISYPHITYEYVEGGVASVPTRHGFWAAYDVCSVCGTCVPSVPQSCPACGAIMDAGDPATGGGVLGAGPG